MTAEGVVRAEYRGVPCQIRMDWFSPKHGIVDLKTCDSLKWFENDCRRYGYIFQMVESEASEKTRATVGHILAVAFIFRGLSLVRRLVLFRGQTT